LNNIVYKEAFSQWCSGNPELWERSRDGETPVGSRGRALVKGSGAKPLKMEGF